MMHTQVSPLKFLIRDVNCVVPAQPGQRSAKSIRASCHDWLGSSKLHSRFKIIGPARPMGPNTYNRLGPAHGHKPIRARTFIVLDTIDIRPVHRTIESLKIFFEHFQIKI